MRLHHVYPSQSTFVVGMSWDFPFKILVTWSTQQRFISHQCRLIKRLLTLVASLEHLAELDSLLAAFFIPYARATGCRMSSGWLI